MGKQYNIRIEIVNMIMRFMIIFTILGLFTVSISNDSAYTWKSLILFQAAILSFLIGKYTKHIWSYILLHLLLLTVYFFLTEDIILKVIYIIFILIYAIIQFALDLKRIERNTSPAFFAVFLLMYFMCIYRYPQEVLLGQFYFIFAVGFILLYVLNRHFTNFYYYINKYIEKANVPFKQMNRSNNGFIVIFLILCYAAMMVATRLPIGSAFRLIGIFLRKLLRLLLSGFTHTPVEEQEDPPEEIPLNYGPPELPKHSALMILISNIIFNVTKVLIVILIVALISYGLYMIYRMYYQRTRLVNTDEKIEVISPFEKKNIGLADTRGTRKNIFGLFGRSNNEKIRKQYKRAIQKNSSEDKKLMYYTPSELSPYAVTTEKKLAEKVEKSEKEKTLTTLYEKARYSQEECSKEDFQSVKNILK